MPKISIHAPLTGCDPFTMFEPMLSILISIHAPLTGCDRVKLGALNGYTEFQSTHPLRDATVI